MCKPGHGERSLKKRGEDDLSGELCRTGKRLTTGLDGGLIIEGLTPEMPLPLCWCSRKAQLGFLMHWMFEGASK